MIKEIKYGALSGKSRAMFGRLLRRDDYMALMKKKNVEEAVSYLKHNTHYKTALSGAGEPEIRRAHLENMLKGDLINDYRKLLKFTHGEVKKLINLLYVRIEVENLKLIFRSFEAGRRDEAIIGDSLRYLSEHNGLDFTKLAMAKNPDEFLQGLKGTDYYNVLRPFVSGNGEGRLFGMGMAMDQYYMTGLQNYCRKIRSGKNLSLMKEFTGFESDAFNIFLIYRSKAYYDIGPEVIRSYTLPSVFNLKKNVMDQLIEAADLNEFFSILDKTPYGFLFQDDGKLFEHQYSEFAYKLHRKRFRSHPFSVACVVSYLRMRETELANVISIIEGIRYGLPPERIQKYVTGMDS